MDYAQALWLYLVLLFGIIVVPGMDMFFVLANALTRGRRAGFAAVGGIMLGGAVHTLFGALAVGVLATLPVPLFQGMILAGAAYMAWIGYALLRSSITVDSIGGTTARPDRMIFWQGPRCAGGPSRSHHLDRARHWSVVRRGGSVHRLAWSDPACRLLTESRLFRLCS